MLEGAFPSVNVFIDSSRCWHVVFALAFEVPVWLMTRCHAVAVWLKEALLITKQMDRPLSNTKLTDSIRQFDRQSSGTQRALWK